MCTQKHPGFTISLFSKILKWEINFHNFKQRGLRKKINILIQINIKSVNGGRIINEAEDEPVYEVDITSVPFSPFFASISAMSRSSSSYL